MLNTEELVTKENYGKISLMFKEIIAVICGTVFGISGFKSYYCFVFFAMILYSSTRYYF